jgi:hypothetical protein
MVTLPLWLISLRTGATITYSTPATAARNAPSVTAVVVEVKPNGTAELDNGQTLPAADLALVATDEAWVCVTGYGGRYWLSSHGKVVSANYQRSGRVRLLRVLAPAVYPAVALRRDGRTAQVGLNRLVAQHFLPPPAEARLTHVLPKDHNILNLRADNLYWADLHETSDPVAAERLHPSGEGHARHRLTTAQVAQVRQLIAQGATQQVVADQFGVSRVTVSYIVNGQMRRKG